MKERRVVFSFGVIYNTSADVLASIPRMIRQIIAGLPNTRVDRAHFASYGTSSLNFEVVYYMLSGDYNQYMDTQQQINLAIYRAFEEQGIRFAHPTVRILSQDPHIEEGLAESHSSH